MVNKIELVSFNLCPFVQRSVITLLQKNITFDIRYIDLSNPPDWFNAISPLGKVPLLQVDGEVLFESAVINEYLDEITPPSLHPEDVLQKAKNRAWIEFASDMIGNQYLMSIEKDTLAYEQFLNTIQSQFNILEKQLIHSPYFNGTEFSLADAAFAPLFMRYAVMQQQLNLNIIPENSALSRWSQALLGLPSVKQSVIPEFDQLFIDYLRNQGGCIMAG
ncbi:MAG: glutathione S-transferase family protein [Gammaproteobacteria bacterium]|nr:glutathione S-transferase family protein [Gammaproteobacteria bacterium]MDH5730532.1 glutathione S-transferase family protein [Gammaproteobacteria bacterium]